MTAKLKGSVSPISRRDEQQKPDLAQSEVEQRKLAGELVPDQAREDRVSVAGVGGRKSIRFRRRVRRGRTRRRWKGRCTT